MAEKILVKNILTDEMKNAGRELISRLDNAKFKVNTAMWFFFPESDSWKLIIVSPEVKRLGPTKVYEKIRSIISKMPLETQISLKDISVMKTNEPLISSVRSFIKTGKGISEIPVISTSIHSHFIEDALIYRST